MSAESFMRPGAVDLSSLAARSRPPAAAGNGAVASVVVDVTDATFEAEVLTRSLTVPVVIDLWAEWCGPCKQLSPILEKLAREYDGRILLAKVDVDANPQLSAAFQVQSIPSVFAVVKGQPVPLFQGAIPEPQVRQVIDQLLEVAATNGVSGRLQVATSPADADAAESSTEPQQTRDTTQPPTRSRRATSPRPRTPTGRCWLSLRPTRRQRPGWPRSSCSSGSARPTQRRLVAQRTPIPPMSAPSSPPPTSTSPTGRSTTRLPGWSTLSGGWAATTAIGSELGSWSCSTSSARLTLE